MQRKTEKDRAYTAVYKVNRSDFLLEFLLRKCNTSRNNVKSLLSRRQILVNGSVVTQFDFPLAKDDEVRVAKAPVRGAQEAKKPEKSREKGRTVQRAEPLKIVYEDDDFIVLDKPAGLLSVESDKDGACAYAQVFTYLSAQGKNVRPYILHRIDKETSGVLAFAKNVKLHFMLKMRWNELVTVREYYAVAEGVFEKKEDVVVSYLKENKNNVMYSTFDTTGQRAVTRYQVVAEKEGYSLLRVQIDTGRKNQIRVHMQSLSHPLVGDEKYGGTKNPLKRLGLHASRLEFIHPVSGQTVSFSAPVPSVFRAFFGGK